MPRVHAFLLRPRPALVAALLLLAAAGRPPSVGAEVAKAPEVAAARAVQDQHFELARRLTPAFVFIGGGSGVVVSADGLMLTNHHVAGASKRWKVRVGDRFQEARVLGSDPRGDLCLLQIEKAKGMPFVEVGDSDRLTPGQHVMAIGNPFGASELIGEPTVTWGVISGLHLFHGGYSDAIETDAAVNPGNSGGPLLTLDGRLAGINGQIQTRFGARANTGIGLAISARQIQNFLPALKAANGGRVFHGFIRGLLGSEEEKDMFQNGAEIRGVTPQSPAEKLGLRAGDRIVRCEDYRLRNYNRLQGVLGLYPAGTTVTLAYVRNGETKTAKATLEALNPGSLGVAFRPVRGPGAVPVIAAVHPGLGAERAGLKAGDQITGLDGQPTANIVAYTRAWTARQYLAGDRIEVRVRRGGKEPEVPVTVTLTSAFDEPRRTRP